MAQQTPDDDQEPVRPVRTRTAKTVTPAQPVKQAPQPVAATPWWKTPAAWIAGVVVAIIVVAAVLIMVLSGGDTPPAPKPQAQKPTIKLPTDNRIPDSKDLQKISATQPYSQTYPGAQAQQWFQAAVVEARSERWRGLDKQTLSKNGTVNATGELRRGSKRWSLRLRVTPPTKQTPQRLTVFIKLL